jgi:hypothetical protein
VRFEWDPDKAAANKRKHGVSFAEASECFEDPLALVVDDPKQPDRLILVGATCTHTLLVTVFVERDVAVIRIISARRATSHERRAYEES